jgi:hypothetical protein
VCDTFLAPVNGQLLQFVNRWHEIRDFLAIITVDRANAPDGESAEIHIAKAIAVAIVAD